MTATATAAAITSPPSSLLSAMHSGTAEGSWDAERGLQWQSYSKPCSSKKEGWVVIRSVLSPALGAVHDCSIHFGKPDCILSAFCAYYAFNMLLAVSVWRLCYLLSLHACGTYAYASMRSSLVWLVVPILR
jgi:hypothetical protein